VPSLSSRAICSSVVSVRVKRELNTGIVDMHARVRISALRIFWNHENRLNVPEPIHVPAVWRTDSESVFKPKLTGRDQREPASS
jgi:hypothetical protein